MTRRKKHYAVTTDVNWSSTNFSLTLLTVLNTAPCYPHSSIW